MKKWIAACIVLALAVAVGGKTPVKADDLPIKEVMKMAHTGKPTLLAKVAGGKASDDEKKMLVELYENLGKNKPPKGDEDEWKKKTEDLVAAAKDVAAGTKGANAKLQKASNCGACHGKFKAS